MSGTVLITGCSSGFGNAIARDFLARGWNVVATMRSPRPEMFEANERLRVLPLDVTDSASIAQAVEKAIAAFGQIDVLINNAGVGLRSAVEFTPDDAIRAIFETNYFGAVAMCRAVIPHMRARGSGVIVNVNSAMAIAPMPFMSFYASTKWALQGFSETMSYELLPLGIKVRLLEPGLAPSTRFIDNAENDDRLVPAPYDRIAMECMGLMQRDYPTNLTTEQDVVEGAFLAATDAGDRLRYPVGGDTLHFAAQRLSGNEENFVAHMRESFLP